MTDGKAIRTEPEAADAGMKFTGKPLTNRMRAFGVTSLVRYQDGAIVSHWDAETGRHTSRDVPQCVAEWLSGND